jgi:selenocysteine lyase/cysteine desulfurase
VSDQFTPEERAAIRAEFPHLQGRTYLNYASVGPLPLRARRRIDAINDTFQRLDRNFDPETDQAASQSRAACAELTGGDVAGIGLTPNTSYGLNWALGILRPHPGEAVLICDQEFPALRYAVWHLRHVGVATVTVAVPPFGGLVPEDLDAHLSRHPEVKVVATSWVSFRSGYRADLAGLAKVAHRHGAALLVDAIQGVGTRPLEAAACDLDVVCAAVHKWLCCPVGMGFVWCRPELREERVSPWGGWMSVDWNAEYGELLGPVRDMNRGPRTAEVGTLNFQGVRAMAEATAWISSLGLERIAGYTDELIDLLYQRLDADRFEWLSERDPGHRSSILCLRPRRGDAEGLRRYLSRRGLVTGVREGALRVSPHFPTDRSEIEQLVHSLHEFD